ncbi:DUF892 family protein [Aurantiacibacter sediminis]|uniref:DUF892 family protein n=1 Tax=Aurantiacibacter sediminis TaxID=2793064 RepID=A0ABS0N0U4_9SPHN|nr:DUF892 family protein [Aurantiacibacter sediminis]MBH5321586.1 DUF892 family protein [Aurantiacibacter sediminis]
MSDFNSIYIDQLQDMVSADRQSLEFTKRLRDAASHPRLVEALTNGVCGISDGLDIVTATLHRHDADPEANRSPGMAGLVKEAEERAFARQFDTDEARDAMIVAQYLRITHYGLAAYEALTALAKGVGDAEGGDELQTCLDNARDGHADMKDVIAALLGEEAKPG